MDNFKELLTKNGYTVKTQTLELKLASGFNELELRQYINGESYVYLFSGLVSEAFCAVIVYNSAGLYIAMNGVYENAVLTALKNHSNLNEIVLCVDNDEGGIEAVDRLKDILGDNRYTDVKRLAPKFKDWNEDLKAQNGAEPLPAVPHKRKEKYLRQAENLEYLKCRPDKLISRICDIQKRTIQVSG